MPIISGNLDFKIGDNITFDAGTMFVGRTRSNNPRLTIDSNSVIGYGASIMVGRTVTIGKNVLIAGGCCFYGYPGHPIDPEARRAGEPDTEEQVGDIIIEDNVWIASRVIVNAGVRIGKGSVVAVGSIVTKDLPSNVLAAGNPAKIIRYISEDEQERALHEQGNRTGYMR